MVKALPVCCLAPGVAVIPVIQEHVNASACTFHSISWVVIYEHCCSYFPAGSQTPICPWSAEHTSLLFHHLFRLHAFCAFCGSLGTFSREIFPTTNAQSLSNMPRRGRSPSFSFLAFPAFGSPPPHGSLEIVPNACCCIRPYSKYAGCAAIVRECKCKGCTYRSLTWPWIRPPEPSDCQSAPP